MNQRIRNLLWQGLGTLLIVTSFDAVANSCDCTQIIGACQGQITLTPTGAQKGLYGADLAIQANAPQCAKVEYFIDNTPAFTILANGHSGSDRVMGTSASPLTNERVTYQACRVCKAEAASDKQAGDKQTPRSDAENIFAAALANDTFDPNGVDAAFQSIPSNSGESGMSNLAGMVQTLQQVQSLNSATAAQAAKNITPTSSQSGKAPRDCMSPGFRVCDFGTLSPAPK